jgi:hypothetical protein
MQVSRFLVEGSHFKLLDSEKGAPPNAVLVREVADETILSVTFTMQAKGTAAQFKRAIKKASGQGLTIADVKAVQAVTTTVRTIMERSSVVPVTDEKARDLLERCQWNCTRLRGQLVGAKASELRKLTKKIQKLRAAFKRARGQALTNEEIAKLQDGSFVDRMKLGRAMRKDGVQPAKRDIMHKMHGEWKADVPYKVVKEQWGNTLHVYRDEKTGKEFIDSDGSALKLPTYYLGCVKGLHGLRARAHARSRVHILDESKVSPRAASKFPAQATAYEVSKLEGFPVDDWTKAKHKVAVCYNSLGGDNGTGDLNDTTVLCQKIGRPVPKYFYLSPDNTPADGSVTDDATMENRLDRQEHVAHGFQYSGCIGAANTSDSFAGTFQLFIATDTVNVDGEEIPLLGMSCSWGMPAVNVAPQDRSRYQTIGTNGLLKHKLITVATGDNGSKDGTNLDTTDSPAETVGFIGAAACYIDTSDGKTIDVIEVWFDGTSGTGGGISDFFAQIDGEKQYNLPASNVTGKAGHSESFLAGNGDPRSGPYVFWNGKWYRVGGTSACAPEVVAKLIMMNVQLKNPVPDFIAFGYAHFVEGICRQVTAVGTNGGYQAKPSDKNGMNVPVGAGMISYASWMKVMRRVQDGVTA